MSSRQKMQNQETKIDLNKKNIPRLLTHHGVSLGETLGKLVVQACATLLTFHAVFGTFPLNFPPS